MAILSQLENSIIQQAKEIRSDSLLLENYAKRPSAYSDYVQKRTESLNRRIVTHNLIEREFQKISLIYPLAEPVHELMADSEIGTVIIHLKVKPNKKESGHINYNPFQ